tara:strand:- start:1261 stop:1485 length:225 start_codon:yes stop_codon:yes gene_type:complete
MDEAEILGDIDYQLREVIAHLSDKYGGAVTDRKLGQYLLTAQTHCAIHIAKKIGLPKAAIDELVTDAWVNNKIG